MTKIVFAVGKQEKREAPIKWKLAPYDEILAMRKKMELPKPSERKPVPTDMASSCWDGHPFDPIGGW